MATIFTSPSDTARLMDTHRPAQSEANRSTNTSRKNRSIAGTFKSIELLLMIIALWMINNEEELTVDTITKFVFAILGAFIILPVVVKTLLIDGEIPPRLLDCVNRLGTILISAVVALMLYDGRFGVSSIFFSTLTAVLYAIDTHVNSKMPPTVPNMVVVRRRYVRYTHG